jgi:hypothetical protein
MTKIKLTENERAVLRGTYDSWYRRGSPPVGHAVWSWSANPWGDAQGRKFGGVVAALMRKGLLDQSGTGRQACVALTQAGWDAIRGEVS